MLPYNQMYSTVRSLSGSETDTFRPRTFSLRIGPEVTEGLLGLDTACEAWTYVWADETDALHDRYSYTAWLDLFTIAIMGRVTIGNQ